MFRRQHLLVSFSVVLVTAALASGCSEDTQHTPRVTFDGSINPGKHGPVECPKSASPWFQIGSFGNPSLGRVNPNDLEGPLKDPGRRVDDGADEQQGKAAVSCSVVESGDAFNVALQAELSGATGGTMTLKGRILRGIESPDVTFFIGSKGETFSSTSCVVTFNTLVGHGIAAGRVWGFVDCPNAEAPTQNRICATRAEFRFENCGQ